MRVAMLVCHCRAVGIELLLDSAPEALPICDCSICRRRGAVVASVPLAQLRVVRGAEYLRLYQFNTYTAKHYFCSVCGIYTHHQRRSDPGAYAINMACIEMAE